MINNQIPSTNKQINPNVQMTKCPKQKSFGYCNFGNWILFGICCLIIGISGCGYTTGSLLPSHIKAIYVKPFRNKIELTDELTSDEYRFRTYRANLETDITKKVIERFISDGNLKIVKEEDADVILSGELIDYLREPVRYGADNEVVEEYRISIVCSAKFEDLRKNEVIWEESRIIGDSSQSLSGTFATSESAAVSSAVSDLVRRIVNRTIEGW